MVARFDEATVWLTWRWFQRQRLVGLIRSVDECWEEAVKGIPVEISSPSRNPFGFFFFFYFIKRKINIFLSKMTQNVPLGKFILKN